MAIYLFPFIVSALATIMLEAQLIRRDRIPLAFALACLAIFSGFRYQVGQDWEAYQAFFDQINLNANVLDVYGNEPQQFEIGFYLLNYVVKFLGGTYSIVFLVASTYLAIALYRFTSNFIINRFYVLTIYIGYSFLILNFAQVRQALALGTFLLACDHYYHHRNKLQAATIACLGALFQYTSLMYAVLFLAAVSWPRKKGFAWAILALLATGLYLVSQLTDFYTVLSILSATSSIQGKIEVYRDTQTEQGVGQQLYAAYLLVLVWYLSRYDRRVPENDRFVVVLAQLGLLLTVCFVVTFPGSYAMYSRAYVMGSIFQALALCIVYKSATENRLFHQVVLWSALLASLLSYVRLVSFYSEEYLPYRSIVFN